jgi:hypothetical protein
MLYPAPGGPGVATLERVLAHLAPRARIVSVSVTTWALNRDAGRTTEAAVWRVLGAAIGERLERASNHGP